MTEEELVSYLKEDQVELNQNQLNQLKKYYKILIEWNQKMNLTGITEEKDVYLKHFYDSYTLNKAIDLKNELSLCDIGSGAGLPGIVLKIIFPSLKITLIDSLNKRIIFLKNVINELNLENIEAFHSRAEDFAKHNFEKYDIVTARAVTKLNILNELCLPLVKKEGHFIAMKANLRDELDIAKSSLNILGGAIENKIHFKLPFEDSERNIIVIKKVKSTPKIYPRTFDKIKKNPL